ncbi:MAG: hypothetical protein JXB33_01425 [Clostridia bacterium]|nr:hypothetical protein [Clostridia bacterium]
MQYSRFCSFFALIAGLLMIFMWLFFIFAGMVPEFAVRPAEITLHLIAEFTTALALAASGILMLRKHLSARWLFPFSTGMLMYTIIVSPGYYIQSGDYIFVLMFGILIVLSFVCLVIHAKALSKKHL